MTILGARNYAIGSATRPEPKENQILSKPEVESVSPLILSIVLVAALLHAVWNALIKVSGDRLVIMGVTAFGGALLAFPFVLILPAPAPESWPYLFLSLLAHVAYMLLLVKAYGFGDFAQIYPISRGTAPLLTAFFGYLILAESFRIVELLGILLIVAGIFLLAFERKRAVFQLSSKALVFSLLTGASISCYSLVDGIGARLSGNSHSFTAWMFFIDGAGIPVIAAIRRRAVLAATVRQVWKPGLVVAVTSSIAYWLVIWAFSQEKIAAVAALRETSVLFAMLISVFVLKESFSLFRVIVAAMIVSGIFLLLS